MKIEELERKLEGWSERAKALVLNSQMVLVLKEQTDNNGIVSP